MVEGGGDQGLGLGPGDSDLYPLRLPFKGCVLKWDLKVLGKLSLKVAQVVPPPFCFWSL